MKPVLTYEAQSWALEKTHMESLRKTQSAMERNIMKMKLKDKIRNSAIREVTGMKDLGYTAKKLKFIYAGHLMRSERDIWAKIMIIWGPFDRKKTRERPLGRWSYEIEKEVGPEWTRKTNDRKKWREIGGAYASQYNPQFGRAGRA